MAVRKPSRVAFSTKEPLIWSRGAKARAWTKKSILPKAASTAANPASMLASSVTSTGSMTVEPTLSARGRTRRSMPGRWKKASSAPWAASWLAMPQAMDWWLATPVMIPRLPFISSPRGMS